MASLQQNALRSSLSGSIAYCKDALPLPRRCLRRSSKKLGCTAVMTPPKEQVGAQTKDAAQDMAYWMEQESKFVVQTYARAPVVFKSGHGSTLVDLDGREYIDLAGGIAVNALGHSHPVVTDTIAKQSAELMHISNLYHNIPQISLAKRLVESSFADRVFFANSGTEANEAAIKFSRKYQRKLFEQKQGTNGSLGAGEGPATEFVAFSNCFHGRTMGAVALTAKSQYREPFAPVMPGVVGFPTYGDLESARAYIRAGKTAAVFVEPVQGEGGVYPATKEFLQGLRHLCDKAGALLVFDEIQCGLGRTGVLWAHEAYGIQPDIMTVAKPLAGGLPIGAVLVNEKVASAMAYGDHGSTFAGNPLVCAVALSVLDVVQEPGFLEGVAKRGEDMRENLRNGLEGVECVKEVRGSGLIIGVQLDRPAGTVVDMAREKGVLVITAGKGDVIRMVPPLIITEEELKRAGDTIVACIKALK